MHVARAQSRLSGGRRLGFVAWNILRRASEIPQLHNPPNAWLSSDGLLAFLNTMGWYPAHLKYKSTEEIRQDHPNLIEAFQLTLLPSIRGRPWRWMTWGWCRWWCSSSR